jgi:hypothetical protein
MSANITLLLIVVWFAAGIWLVCGALSPGARR